jgi:hypothetical protein
MSDRGQSRATILLFFLFFFGFAVTLLAVIDLQWTHRLLVRDAVAAHVRQERR